MMRSTLPNDDWWADLARSQRNAATALERRAVLDDAIAVAGTLAMGHGPLDAIEARFDERHLAWDEAAEAGDPSGCWLVGLCLLHGIGTARDVPTGLELIESAAAHDFAPAQHSLARLRQGDADETLTETNVALAIAGYEAAAEQGYPPSMCNLGVAYLEGNGVPHDVRRGLEWLERAARAGNAVAQINLGALYADGELVREDPVEAARWYRMAAELGHPGALCLLGMCFEDGLGVVRDLEQAARCYRLAADGGDVEARLLLGYCYEEGNGVRKDATRAAECYRLAAEAGNAHAQVAWGSSLRHGIGVARDIEQAVKWFGLASEQGDVEATYQLATCYSHGQGVPRDHAAAVELYRACVPAEHPDAIYSLGVAYSRGDGVERNLELAFRYFEKAASLGSEAAIETLRVQPGGSADDLAAVTAELSGALLDPTVPFEMARAAAMATMEVAASLGPDDADAMQATLAETIAAAPIDRAGVAALVCGAVVESGASPGIALEPLVARLPQVLELAAGYLRACRRRHLEQTGALLDDDDRVDANREPFVDAGLICGAGGDDDLDLEPRIAPSVEAWVVERQPELGAAWHALDFWCQPTIAMLTRDDDARQRLDTSALLTAAAAVRHEHRGAAYLHQLLTALDGEDLLVLEPETNRGYRVRARGITDNFQLQTLLADLLIGDPDEGWLEGVEPEADVVAVADGTGPQQIDLQTVSHWEMYAWTAVRPDGTLAATADDAEHRILIEEQPAEIPAFEGTRTLLLSRPRFPRTWSACRTFGALTADIELVEILDADAVDALLKRMAANGSRRI